MLGHTTCATLKELWWPKKVKEGREAYIESGEVDFRIRAFRVGGSVRWSPEPTSFIYLWG